MPAPAEPKTATPEFCLSQLKKLRSELRVAKTPEEELARAEKWKQIDSWLDTLNEFKS